MAISVEARTDIIGLVVGMFGAAPGASVLSSLVASYESGSTISQIAANLSATAEFKSIYPTFLTNGEYATKVVANLLVEASVEAKAEAVAVLTAALNGGMTRSTAMVEAIKFVSATATDNATFGTSAAAFDNKVAVAVYYSVDKQLSGDSLAQLQNVVAAVGSTAASVTTAKAAVDGVSNVGTTFTLTAGVNTVSGFAGDDTIIGDSSSTGATTLTALDNIDGGAGNDTLSITDVNALTIPTSATVKNVETANITTGGALNGDVSGWTGLTTLKAVSSTTAAVAQTVTAGATDVDLTSTYTDTTAGGGITTGAITVNGGKTVKINAVINGELNQTTTVGAISVTGTADTTAVTATQTAPATASATVKGVVNGTVSITDVNSASTTSAGKITTVSLTNFGAATVNTGALATVNLSGKGTSFDASTSGALTTATATTVGLNVNGLTTTGAVTFDTDVKTLNVDSSTAASTINSLVANSATAVNISGDKTLTLTGQTIAATAVVTSTNSAGVTLGTALATGSSFVGGDGADTITLTAGGTKAITMGAGDDTVNYAGAMGTGGSVDAGAGTDVIKMTAAQAVTATGSTAFAATVSNFEVLEISAATGAAAAINMANADGINSLTTNGVTVGALTVTNAAADFTYTQKALSSFASSIALATDTGTTDNVNLAYSAADGFTSTAALTVANVESIKITTTDANTTAQTAVIVTPITAAAATTVTVSGNMGVSLIGGMTQTTLTSLDASGLTATGAFGGLTWTSGALAAAATVKGGAAGTNVIDFSAATKAVTYTGGTGADTINFASANAQANVVTLGNGTNTFNGGTNATGNNSITGGTGVDTILVGNGNNTISAGEGADVLTIGSGSNTVTLGAGADIVNFAAAAASSAVFTTITDIAAGDQLDFTTVNAVTNAVGKLGAALTSGVSDYQTFLNAAAGKGAGTLSWFQFGGDTFIVQDVSATNSFAAGTDHVVKLTGLVDLSNSTIAAGDVLTIV